MKLLMAIGGTGALVGGLYAGDALTAGQVYPLPIGVARSQLVTMPVAPQLLHAVGGSDSATAVVESASGSTVRWRIFLGGRQVSQFTATLEPAGPGATRVTLDQAAAPAEKSMAERLTSTSFMRSYAASILEEQVDARLNGRQFDAGGALQSFAQEVANDPRHVRGLGEATRGMFMEVHNQARADAHAGARPADPWMQMRAATKPSVDLSKTN